jgi:UDP-glucose 4-epimerase
MNILVIGGSGQVGSHLIKSLKPYGHRISAVDLVQILSLLDVSSSLYKRERGDMRFMHDVVRKERIELAVHAAGFLRTNEAIVIPMKYYSNNITGNVCLLNVLFESNVKKTIYVPSAAVFSEQDKLPISDHSSKNPINPLGYSQLLLGEIWESLRMEHEISYTSMRALNLSGLSDGEHKHFMENCEIPSRKQSGGVGNISRR